MKFRGQKTTRPQAKLNNKENIQNVKKQEYY